MNRNSAVSFKMRSKDKRKKSSDVKMNSNSTNHSYSDSTHVEIIKPCLHCVVLSEGRNVLLKHSPYFMSACDVM